jgi:hypothetical protein
MTTQTTTTTPTAEQQHDREFKPFYHPRTLEKIAFCTDNENRNVPEMAIRTKPKSEWKTISGKITVLHSHTEKLNANIPQVAYHRVVNAITETPIAQAKTVFVYGIDDIETFKLCLIPEKTVMQSVNSKKLYFGERKHGYVSLHNIKAHSAPRFIEPFKVQENRKVRITASGKMKLKRF